MSFNGSGVFVINSAGQPVVATTLITAAAMNALTADLATGLSLCLTKDGQQVPTANIPMGTFKITGLGDGASLQDATTLKNIQNGTGVYVATVGGTADAITLTPSPAITAYVAGQTFRFLASGPNTTAATVTISGLAAKAITKNGSTALAAGDIASGSIIAITYDGTRFILNSGGIYMPSILGTARQVLKVNAGATSAAWEDQIAMATPQASTSGSTIDFTGIPAGVKRITISFVAVSTNGTNAILLKIGDSGGIESSAYSSTISKLSNAVATNTSTTSFLAAVPADAAAALNGILTLVLVNAATFTWSYTGVIGRVDSAETHVSAGFKSLSAELDRVQISTVDAFDAGVINIAYS